MTLKRLAEIITELIILEDPLYIYNKDDKFPYFLSAELERGRWEITFTLLNAKNYSRLEKFGNIADVLFWDKYLREYGIDSYSDDWFMDPENANTLVERVEYFMNNRSSIEGMVQELKGDIDEAE